MRDGEHAQFHKDDVVEVTIEDLGASGEGIGHVEGFTLFIKDALPGDTVRAKIIKVKKGYGYARLIKITEPSPFRVRPECPAARPCGGCQVQELSYERQLAFKQQKVREVLIRIGGFEPSFVDCVLQPVLGMEEPWRFRNKAQYPVGERNGQPVAGFYAGRTHHIVPVDDCLIGAPENAQILKTILDYMKQYHVPAYDEVAGKGLVRHVLIRNGHYSGEIMVCLVVNGTKLPKEEKLIAALRNLTFAAPADQRAGKVDGGNGRQAESASAGHSVPGRIVSISLNVNTEKTNVIMGQQVRVLWGRDSIEDSLQVMDVELPVQFRPAGRFVTFRISPLSFYQVNPRQTERLYSLVRYCAGLTGKEVVWDLYCGVGTISCFLARDARRVYGVEVIPDAIRDARENARRNGLTNVTFEVGRAEEILPAYVRRMEAQRKAEGKSGPDENAWDNETGNLVDVVVVDPPRKGCDPVCLQTILDAAPRRIVYVSCDPATLARDLRILTDGGYEIQAACPVDMFPHSVHVETVCLLGNRKYLRKPDATINISLDMKEYYEILDRKKEKAAAEAADAEQAVEAGRE